MPQSAVGHLAFVLLKDKYAGNLDAVHEVRDYLKQRGIKFDGGVVF